MVDVRFVKYWSSRYPVAHDETYDPYLVNGRLGCRRALRELTKWKNVGNNGRPMDFSRHPQKESAFQRFLAGLERYFQHDGRDQLRADFRNSAPVWSFFWHHVLYDTPIFDVYAHMAYHWDLTGEILQKNDAKIHASRHWTLYDKYQVWFDQKLSNLQERDESITDRYLDRALFCWGENQN
ncbi:MAG: hypothetical protein HZB84_07795 [Deltaproteobacteria bacterium]|nr:hypothetical protein [Deltaproteobacteria bacterium]